MGGLKRHKIDSKKYKKGGGGYKGGLQNTMYVYGQITTFSRDKKTGKVLVTRGENAGKEIKFQCVGAKPPIQRGQAVRMNGTFQGKTFIVNETEGISKEIGPYEVIVFGVSMENIEKALRAAGVNTLYELYCAEGIEDIVAESIGQDNAKQLYSILENIVRNTEAIDLYNILQKSDTSMDITDALNIIENLKYTASRRKKTVAELILEDPWILHRVPDLNITTAQKIADQIAQAYGITSETKRITGYLIGTVASSVKNGNTFIDKRVLLGRAAGFFKKKPKEISNILYSAPNLSQENGRTIGANDMTAVYLSSVYFMEEAAVKNMTNLIKTQADIRLTPEALLSSAAEWEQSAGINLDNKQKSFIKAVADHKITLLTGRAGSGKSTAIKALIHALQKENIRYAVLAPTGIAAQRVAAETGSDYYTVHRYAGIIDDNIFDQRTQKKGTEKQENDDIIIIDEMSMMTVSTLSALLSVIKPSARLVLAGDPAQLPPIGPGGVFDALLRASGSCNMAHIDLEYSYRMGDNINRAANILRDEGNLIQSESIKILDASTWKEAGEKTKEIVKELLASGIPYEDILVLAKNKGDAQKGTVYLNSILKQAINPTNEKIGKGDPIITTRNDYEGKLLTSIPLVAKKRLTEIRKMSNARPTIYNGTRGIIEEMDDTIVNIIYNTPTGKLQAQYSPMELLWCIELAYATTVHKAQGGKSKYVIFVEPEANKCNRNMMYTALSRCSGQQIILIGSKWDSAFMPITPMSRFDIKLQNAAASKLANNAPKIATKTDFGIIIGSANNLSKEIPVTSKVVGNE